MEKEYFNLFWFSIVTSQVLIFLCMFFETLGKAMQEMTEVIQLLGY